jgi:hypothetical protein
MLKEIETRLPEQGFDDRKTPAGKQSDKASHDELEIRQPSHAGPLKDDKRHDTTADQKRKNFSLFHLRYRSIGDLASNNKALAGYNGFLRSRLHPERGGLLLFIIDEIGHRL